MGPERAGAPRGHPPPTAPGRREPCSARQLPRTRGKRARRSPAGHTAPGTPPFSLGDPAYLQRLHQHPHIGLGDAQRDAQRRGHHDKPEHHGHPHGAHLPHGPHDLHGGQGSTTPAPAAGTGRHRLPPALKARGRPGPPPARPAPPRPAPGNPAPGSGSTRAGPALLRELMCLGRGGPRGGKQLKAGSGVGKNGSSGCGWERSAAAAASRVPRGNSVGWEAGGRPKRAAPGVKVKRKMGKAPGSVNVKGQASLKKGKGARSALARLCFLVI